MYSVGAYLILVYTTIVQPSSNSHSSSYITYIFVYENIYYIRYELLSHYIITIYTYSILDVPRRYICTYNLL